MEVKARAPGKIILSGEHAVVHGSTAVAASINLYTRVTLRFSDDKDDTLTLSLKDVGLEFSWPIGKIEEALHEYPSSISSTPISCSLDQMKSIESLIREGDIPEAKIVLASGVAAFLFLYSSIRGFKPAKVIVSSDLPLGSGLGSSAAICVALSTALLVSSNSASLNLSQKGWLEFAENDRDLLNKWAFEGEKIIHGKPSGIDNTVSTYGNMIKFKSGSLTCIKPKISLKMLITNTKVSRNTKALVAGVSERAARHPHAMRSVFEAVDSVSQEFSSIIQSDSCDDTSISQKEDKIAELMEINQGLLQCMGVSHSSIETVLRTTLKYSLYSKLTGAGGGGCVLTLLPTLLSATVVDKVIAELESCGFQCLIAGLGGKGAEFSFEASS